MKTNFESEEKNMAKGLISVETIEIKDASDHVKKKAAEYEEEYTDLFKTVKSLEEAWAGKDNVAFADQIEGFRDDFDRMKDLMVEYSSFLSKTYDAYTTAQNELEKKAKTLSQGS